MCVEDIRIGRRSRSAEQIVAIGPTATQIIPEDPHRTYITFNGPLTENVTVSTRPDVTFGNGASITSTNSRREFELTKQGDCVTKAWFAITMVGADTMNVMTTSVDEE